MIMASRRRLPPGRRDAFRRGRSASQPDVDVVPVPFVQERAAPPVTGATLRASIAGVVGRVWRVFFGAVRAGTLHRTGASAGRLDQVTLDWKRGKNVANEAKQMPRARNSGV